MTKEVDILRKYNIAASQQRIDILQYLINNKVHPTIDIIYQALSKNLPSLSKTTVYNTLQKFAQQGLVWEIRVSEKELRYDIQTHQHAHFRCEKCKKVYDVDVENMLPEQQEIEGHLVDDCQINYSGLCAKCREE